MLFPSSRISMIVARCWCRSWERLEFEGGVISGLFQQAGSAGVSDLLCKGPL